MKCLTNLECPEVMPSTPKVTDIPEDVSDIDAPQLSVDTDDLPF